MLSPHVIRAITAGLGLERQRLDVKPVRGSSLNHCWYVQAGSKRFFVKTNRAERAEMLAAEAQGLDELAVCSDIAVPGVHAYGVAADAAYLVLDWFGFSRSNEDSNVRLGRALAGLHAHTSRHYGWHRDNTIGLTPQINTPCTDWWEFFREHRLIAQKRFLLDSGVAASRLAPLDEVIESAGALFVDSAPEASLLHGDLWGGNWATLDDGRPCLFDPAVYYGDAETDMAMTRLFGGFSSSFYAAYREIRPDTITGPARRELYRLYHLLNHWNLFGGSYAAQCQRSMKSVLGMI